jgi:hypothetical protein
MAAATTKRPLPATTLAIIQTIIAGANIVIAVVVMLAMRAPEVAPHAREAVHEIGLDAALVALAAIATSFAAVGLWKRWAAGWALTLALGLTVALALSWGPVFDHDHMETDDMAVTAAYLFAIVLALLPAVRHWYLHRTAATTVPANSAQSKSGY